MTPDEFRRLHGPRVDSVIPSPLGGIGPIADPPTAEEIEAATGIPQPGAK